MKQETLVEGKVTKTVYYDFFDLTALSDDDDDEFKPKGKPVTRQQQRSLREEEVAGNKLRRSSRIINTVPALQIKCFLDSFE